jgi:hypothetical protein
VFDEAFEIGDAAAELVDAGEFDADTEFDRRPACDTGLTELGELRSKAEKSTGDCAPVNPLNMWSSDSMPDVGGLLAEDPAVQSYVVACGVGCELDEDGVCIICIGDCAKSYGDGSANDMYIGLLAMVLYGLVFGWPANP